MQTNTPNIIEDLTLTPLPVWWQEPWAVLLALVGVVVLGWWMRRVVGRRPGVSLAPERPSGPPPHLEALERLGALRKRLGSVSAHELALEASDLLRVYLEARFELRIRYQTTREFLEEAAKQPALLKEHRERLAEFLGVCDLSKFAHEAVDLAGQERLLTSAETVVRSTTGDGALAKASGEVGTQASVKRA